MIPKTSRPALSLGEEQAGKEVFAWRHFFPSDNTITKKTQAPSFIGYSVDRHLNVVHLRFDRQEVRS